MIIIAISVILCAGGNKKIYKYYDDGVLHLTNISIEVPTENYTLMSSDKNIMLRRAKKYMQYIKDYCNLYNVPEELVVALIMAESSFIPTAISKDGACGLMQITKNTARFMGIKGDIFDPRENIRIGIKYMRFLLDYFNNDMIKAVAAYNAGPQKIKKYRDVPPYRETQNFVRNVLENYYELVRAKTAHKPTVLYSQRPESRTSLYIYYDKDGNLRITDVKRD